MGSVVSTAGSIIGRYASNGILVIGESENKVEEVRGNSLEKEVVERKAIKKKSYGRKSRHVGRKANIRYTNLIVK